MKYTCTKSVFSCCLRRNSSSWRRMRCESSSSCLISCNRSASRRSSAARSAISQLRFWRSLSCSRWRSCSRRSSVSCSYLLTKILLVSSSGNKKEKKTNNYTYLAYSICASSFSSSAASSFLRASSFWRWSSCNCFHLVPYSCSKLPASANRGPI